MVNVFIRTGDGRIISEHDPACLAMALRDPKAVFWVDMDKPDEEELALLDDVFGFHPLAIEDTIQYNQRPKIESYNHVGDLHNQGYFYLVIHGPDLKSFKDNLRTKELDIFVSERYLVTIHEESMLSVDAVMKRAQADAGRVLDTGVDMILYNILDQLVDHYNPILDHLNESLEALEDEAVQNPHPSLLNKISHEKRELMMLRRIIGPQRDVLAQLTRGEVPFIRESTRVYLRDVYDHLVRAVEMMELYRELVVSARDLYLSSINNNLNNVMKSLTLITVIALPINIMTGFFGMNFEQLPGIHDVKWFWFSMAIMGSAVAAMAVLFVKKKWI
ncbi:MAG: magnesium/cobalt transporter CorA [Tepidisphaeraceae bacterium]